MHETNSDAAADRSCCHYFWAKAGLGSFCFAPMIQKSHARRVGQDKARTTDVAREPMRSLSHASSSPRLITVFCHFSMRFACHGIADKVGDGRPKKEIFPLSYDDSRPLVVSGFLSFPFAPPCPTLSAILHPHPEYCPPTKPRSGHSCFAPVVSLQEHLHMDRPERWQGLA